MNKAHTISLPIWILIVFCVLVLGFIVASFVFGVYHVMTDTGLPSPMATFVSNQFHISIEYPQTWVAFEMTQGSHGDDEAIVFVGHAGPAGHPRVLIAQRKYFESSLSDAESWGLVRIERWKGSHVTINYDSISNPNSAAILRRYSSTSETLFGRINRIDVVARKLMNFSVEFQIFLYNPSSAHA